jgi:DNA polymerase-3 subunit epsilon
MQSSRSIRVRPFALPPRLSDAERAAHGALVATLGAKAIWNEYRREVARAASE